MTDREKLVELIEESASLTGYVCAGEWNYSLNTDDIADHLIANGVTVLPPKKTKKPTDLTGKCGSCAHAVPKNVGGSTCYVLCANPERRHMKRVEFARQRTYKACKMYKPLPEPPKED